MERNDFDLRIVRSDRKTVAIRITPAGQVEVRCPRKVSDREILSVLEQHRNWIVRHLEQQAAVPQLLPFTRQEIETMKQAAKKVFPERVSHYAKFLGVPYGRVAIRAQRTKWGSCSSKGNLNFNCVLMLAPPEVVDYVVVHELCHLKEMNHSAAFWTQVARLIPDYPIRRKWLREHAGELIGRLP